MSMVEKESENSGLTFGCRTGAWGKVLDPQGTSGVCYLSSF